MEFTKEELFEIEKLFDIHTSMLLQQRTQEMNGIAKLPDCESKSKLMQKMADDTYVAYDTYRGISAKAWHMHGEVKA